MQTNKQRKKEERRRAKEARRSRRQEAEWSRNRHKARQHDPYRCPDFVPEARPLRQTLAIGLATAVVMAALDDHH